jgi:hypothetical protein
MQIARDGLSVTPSCVAEAEHGIRRLDGSRRPARKRRTKAQMEQLARQIIHVLSADHPQSTRHVFYRMTDPRLPEPVEKSKAGCVTVQRLLVQLRRQGLIPYGWIIDATRRGYFTRTWNNPADAVAEVASLYRRSYWGSASCYVEVCVESRSLASVILEDCRRYAVPLYPAGGFTSASFAWEAAEQIERKARGRPAHVLYIGDYDPAGVLIDKQIERELRRHLGGQQLDFHRLGVTAEQVRSMGSPTKPPKDQRGGFTDGTVEAEALPASVLRDLLCDAIERFIDPAAMTLLEVTENSEREYLKTFAEALPAGA